MIAAAVAGFLLGGSLIVAIGAQNAFVLRQGLRRRHVFAVAAICAASDAALIAAGVGGLGSLIAAQPSLLVAARVGGALFLFAYGCRSFLRAARPGQLVAGGGGGDDSLGAAVAACLAFTFLNPHVYLDTVVLLGGISAAYAGIDRVAFAGGAADGVGRLVLRARIRGGVRRADLRAARGVADPRCRDRHRHVDDRRDAGDGILRLT